MALRRFAAGAVALAFAATGLVACGNDEPAAPLAEGDTIRIGTTDREKEAWSVFEKKAADIEKALVENEQLLQAARARMQTAVANMGEHEQARVALESERRQLLERREAARADAQEAADAAAPATPEEDDARAKYRGWADRIRVDIDDVGAGALTDWQAEMAELDANAPDLARELRDYAAA